MLMAASTSKAGPKKAREAVKKFNEFLAEHFDDGDEDH
jgi:mannose/cellobiose epimerase-like protein (N-acyl-D-glucosamine 2-epimerase family)